MKKVLLRLLVAGIVLAIIVIVLLNTVFKAESSLQAHNEIASAISPSGEITKLTEMLDDDVVLAEFPNVIYIINSEIVTLKTLYTKIIVTKENSDKKANQMINSLNTLTNNLQSANDKLFNIKNSQATGEVKKRMVEDLKNVLNSSMISLKNLNQSLCEYLISYYYNNSLDTTIALNYIKVAYAQVYFDDSSSASLANYTKVSTECSNESLLASLSANKDFNTLLFNAKSVNLYKVITDNEYANSLNEDDKIKAEQIKNCIDNLVI